jgi:hypothetical protein
MFRVVCISFGGDQVISWVIPPIWRGPCLPLYSLEGQVYMEVLVGYMP